MTLLRRLFAPVILATLFSSACTIFLTRLDRDAEELADEALESEASAADSEEHDRSLAALRKELSFLRADLEALGKPAGQEDLERLSAQVLTLQQELASEAGLRLAEDADEHEIAVAAETLTAERAEQLAAERRQTLYSSFESEELDADWSGAVTDELQDVLAHPQFSNVSIYQMGCRSTLCRLEIEHDDPDLTVEFELWFAKQVAGVSSRFAMFEQEVGGRAVSVIYLARQGHRLPN